MRAVRLHGVHDLRVETVATPVATAPDEVTLTVAAAGICGSDLHNYATGRWLSRTPVVPGHELCGIVTSVGDSVLGLRPGDHVVADSRYWCGGCEPCVEGRRHLCERLGFVGEVCDGGFAERVVLPRRLLHRIDRALDPRIAAMAEPLAVALHAVRRLDGRSGEPILILGCGTIGGLAALVLSRIHNAMILVSDRNVERAIRVAAATGATRVALEREALRTAAPQAPIRHVIEATGSVAALRGCIESIDAGARIALVGIFHERLDLDLNTLVEREIALIGCHAYDGEMTEAIGLLPAIGADLLGLVDAEIGLDEVPAAYARLAAGRSRGLKTVIVPARRSPDDGEPKPA